MKLAAIVGPAFFSGFGLDNDLAGFRWNRRLRVIQVVFFGQAHMQHNLYANNVRNFDSKASNAIPPEMLFLIIMSISNSDIRILHVDDDSDFSDLTAEYLRQRDDRFAMEIVTSASEGLERLEKKTVHCIVSDFEMPGMDGIEFLESVRESRPDLPFILYTGKGSEEVASRAVSAGVTDYLQKEIGTSQYDVLANRIENAVSRSRTREELERNQDLLQDAEKIAQVGGWEANVETGEQRWTEGTYEIHDIDPNSGFNPTVDAGVEFYHPDDQDQINRLVQRCIDTGEPYDVELRLVTAEDQHRWVRAIGKPIRNDQETIVTIRGAIRDITEQKEYEHEINRLNQRHETVLSNIRETVFVTDDDGQFTYICPNIQFIFGYDAGEVADIGSVEALLGTPPIDLAALESHGEVVNVETTVSDADGDRHTVLVSVREADIEDGTRLYTIRDITERKEGERELQERNQQLQGVLDSVEAAIWIRNLDSRFELVNQNFRDLFGFAESTDIIGKKPSDLFSEEIAAQFRENDHRVITTEEPVEIEEKVPTEFGDRTYLTRIRPLFDADGELFATCGVASDITTQKKQENELKRQNQRLEEFASIASHDLRNPLNVARGRLQMAMEERNSEHLDAVARSQDRMGALIDDILSLAREGDQVSETESVDLAELVQACWQNVQTKDATIRPEIERTVQADASRLQQLFENLFRNAVEHSGQEVTITIGETEDGFYVEDDGLGIPEEAREEVFDAGFSTSDGGAGFGLSIVRQVVTAHGWEIEAAEGSTGGARFEISGVKFLDN
jgi:PAS domain S-box-containing protein